MAGKEPSTTKLASQFSSPGATATPWSEARDGLDKAQVYWLTTVRPDGRPHVTPLLAIWLDDALHFCTGPGERKAKNLRENSQVILTTGNNTQQGLDIVLEGEAVEVSEASLLERLADAWAAKYEGWHFDVRDGAFYGEGGRALVYAVAPVTAFGFGKGAVSSQTRWRF